MAKRAVWHGGTRRSGGSIKNLERELQQERSATKEKGTKGTNCSRTHKDLVLQHAKRAIRSKANKERRKGWDLSYALKYLDSMLEGSGQPPSKRPSLLDKSIQRMFAVACVVHDVPDRTFPGQRQPWYRERKAEAIEFVKKQR